MGLRFKRPDVTFVDIDIKPRTTPNSINPRSGQNIPVAILTTVGFDATMIDPLTVRFGPGGGLEAHARGHIKDVDLDGDDDLLLHFKTEDTQFQCGDTSGTLTGQTVTGLAIEGVDLITIIGCE